MISILYLALGVLFSIALTLVLIFYYRNRRNLKPIVLPGLITFISILTFSAYFACNQLAPIKQWYAYGKRQYQFLTEYEKLGGINGMIKRIQRRLADNPEDFQGWVMLGKLRLAKLEYKEAGEAFDQALRIRPDDPEIQKYDDLAKRS